MSLDSPFDHATLRGRRVLVTGAGGFIGSALTAALVEAGAEVTALVRYNALGSTGNLALLDPAVRDGARVIFGHLEDETFLSAAMRRNDIVFHLAALISIPYSYASPRAYLRTNVEGTLNLLQAARQADVGRVVLTSTSEVYGDAQYEPMDEAHPLRAQSPYAASKIAADALGESFARAFDLPVVLVRPFNTYGPRQSARAVIPSIIAQALWRDHIALGDPTPRRDLLFVEDTARGFMAAAVADVPSGRVFNLGTGRALTIGDYADGVRRLAGAEDKPFRTEQARLRPGASEVRDLCCDASRAGAELGWRATVDLVDGLARTIAFMRAHPQLYRAEEHRL